MPAAAQATPLPALTLAEFEQLVREVFALVQRDGATAEISASFSKTLTMTSL